MGFDTDRLILLASPHVNDPCGIAIECGVNRYAGYVECDLLAVQIVVVKMLFMERSFLY